MKKETEIVNGFSTENESVSQNVKPIRDEDMLLRKLWEHCHKYPNDAQLGKKIREFTLMQVFLKK